MPNSQELKLRDSDMIVDDNGSRYFYYNFFKSVFKLSFVRYFDDVLVSRDQPNLLTGGRLRDYQVVGANWLHVRRLIVKPSSAGCFALECVQLWRKLYLSR